MNFDLLPLLTAATGVAAALVGGIFFAFSSFVMAGLGRAGPEAGIRAMQQINITVINPLVFLIFLGTAALGAAVAAMALLTTSAGLPIAFGAALYIVGCLGVTGTRNVPLNNALQHAVPGTPDGNAGPKTRTAISAFQLQIGMPTDSLVTDELIARLKSSVAAKQAKTTGNQ